ncbi:MAG: hypothetical protein QF824_03050 [Candidatus Woesearchaeota archaeon]|nr:hypothetical protein [Candidatus Woesearchaeota archaeon]
MKKKGVYLISLVLLIIFSVNVFGQNVGADFESIFKTLSNFNIAEIYSTYPEVVDSILYFVFFIGIAQFGLAKKMEGRGGKSVIIVIGIALAIAMSVWEKNTGWNLGKLAPLAASILILTLAMFIVRIFKGDENAKDGVWIATIVLYIAMTTIFPQWIGWLQESGWGRSVWSIFTILFVIAIPMILTKLFGGGGGDSKFGEGGLMGGLGGGKGGGGKGGGGKKKGSDDRGSKKKGKKKAKKGADLSRAEKDVEENLKGLVKDAQVHQVDEQVRNLKMIKDALEGKGNPKERRQLIIKKLGDVHHGEDNFKAYLKGITDRLAVVGELLNKESFVFKSGEKADIKTRLGLTSRSHISSTDDKLKTGIKGIIEREVGFFKRYLIGARRDAVNDENNFRTKINELVGELRKGEIVAANAAIDGAIRIKDGQKAHFAKMQEGLQAMERLDEGELADFIKIIKNRT